MLAFLFSKYIPLHSSKPELLAAALDLFFSQNSKVLLNCKELSSEMTIHMQTAHLWKAFCTHLEERNWWKQGGKLCIRDSFLVWILLSGSETTGQFAKEGCSQDGKCRYRWQLEGSGRAEDDLLLDLDKLAPSPASCWVNESWEQDWNKDVPQDKADVLQGLNQRPCREAGSRAIAVNQYHLFLLQSTHKSLPLWVTTLYLRDLYNTPFSSILKQSRFLPRALS